MAAWATVRSYPSESLSPLKAWPEIVRDATSASRYPHSGEVHDDSSLSTFLPPLPPVLQTKTEFASMSSSLSRRLAATLSSADRCCHCCCRCISSISTSRAAILSWVSTTPPEGPPGPPSSSPLPLGGDGWYSSGGLSGGGGTRKWSWKLKWHLSCSVSNSSASPWIWNRN